jgi:hypothetical protein
VGEVGRGGEKQPSGMRADNVVVKLCYCPSKMKGRRSWAQDQAIDRVRCLASFINCFSGINIFGDKTQGHGCRSGEEDDRLKLWELLCTGFDTCI